MDSNKMYISQMREFIDLIEKNKKVRCIFDDSVTIMKIIELSEESSKKKTWIKVR